MFIFGFVVGTGFGIWFGRTELGNKFVEKVKEGMKLGG